MISVRLKDFFKKTHFIGVATIGGARPNAAPKYLFKVEGDEIYLADYVMATTWDNLQENPLVSVPFVDEETLVGYQINGHARLLDQGEEYENLVKVFNIKAVKSSVERVVASVRQERPHKNLQIVFPEKPGIIIIKVTEIVDIGPTGKLTRDKE